DQTVEELSDDRIAGEAARPVAPAALAADREIAQRHLHARRFAIDPLAHRADDRFALVDAAARPSLVLDVKPFRRPAGIADDLADAIGPRVLATQADGQDRADVRMPAQRQHQAHGELVVITTGEADDVNVALALGDGVRDVPRALDGI